MNVKYTCDGVFIDDKLITIKEINENVVREKIKKYNFCLLSLEWEGYSRGFDGIQEYRVLPKKNIEELIGIITGIEIYFGEIAGKYSDVCVTIDFDDIQIDDKIDNIVNFLVNNPSGYCYNYSFLDTLQEQFFCDGNKKEAEKLINLYSVVMV